MCRSQIEIRELTNDDIVIAILDLRYLEVDVSLPNVKSGSQRGVWSGGSREWREKQWATRGLTQLKVLVVATILNIA